MTASASAENFALVSREQGRNAINRAMRLFIGRGRRYSVKQVGNATGLPDWMINAAMIDGGSPDNRPLPPEALLSLCAFLGPDFTNEFLHLAHQGAFELPDDGPDPHHLAADNTDDNAKVVRASLDGVWSDNEKPDLKVVGARMVQRGSQLVAAAH